MFEVTMQNLRQGLLSSCLFAYSAISAQVDNYFEFTSNWIKGDKIVYQLSELKFKQNPYGQYLYMQYDTSYMIFNVIEKTDSNTLINLNFADGYYNGIPTNDVMDGIDPLKTETYELAFNNQGAFIELLNWEKFAGILIQNLKTSYINKEIDSLTLKYYYVYYHNQSNVEKTLLPRMLELTSLYGEKYVINTRYTQAREVVNPFGGDNLMKSGTFYAYTLPEFKNSTFFKGQVKTDYDDNLTLQEEYYANSNAQKPDTFIEAAPYIYMVDTYEYQYGNITKKIIRYATTHTVHFGNDKQGLDRTYQLMSY